MRDETQTKPNSEFVVGWPENHMLEAAMGIICNVGQGNWKTQTEEWQRAAERWMAEYPQVARDAEESA